MAIARNTARYTALPTITSGPITALQWNQLTQNTRYIHGTGQLSGSASGRGEDGVNTIYLTNRNVPERFYPIILFPGYTRAVLKLRFNIIVLSPAPGVFVTETLTAKIHRAGSSQKITTYFRNGFGSVPGGSPINTGAIIDRYFVFDLDSAIIPQGQSAEVGRISFEFDNTASQPVPSGVLNFQLQTFSECQ
jgi:hypothetical protein